MNRRMVIALCAALGTIALLVTWPIQTTFHLFDIDRRLDSLEKRCP
jgi:hypothetical protein